MQQPSAQGIASLFRGNPAPLQQRIQNEQQGKPGLPPDLQKLLALNIVTNEKDAVAKQQAMDQLAQMQGQQGKPPTVMQTVQEQARQKMQAQQIQAQRQQQAMQAMAQQAGLGPVPDGTQFAQAQPSAQGIDELPVEFEMAEGGIIAFEKGGKGEYETPYDRMNRENREKEDRKKEEPDKPLDAQAAADRAAIVSLWETLRGGSESAGRAIADVATMIPRGLVGAYDTAVVRPMRAAGLNAAYLSPKLTPEGASPESMTPFTDVARTRDVKKEAPEASRPRDAVATSQGPGDVFVPRRRPETPVADLKGLAALQTRQQAPRPAPDAPAAPVAAPVAPEPTPVRDSDALAMQRSRMALDPEIERIAEQARRLKEIGAPDTSVHDRLIAELEKRKAQLEGPQDSFGRLMEYLGQVAQTPRGLSSFEAGAAGAANLRKVEKARQLEQFDLTKQALDVSQKKLETVRAFAIEQYNVGKARFDQIYREQFEAAKEITRDEREAAKLAQENTLKRLELEKREQEARERDRTQRLGYAMQQLGERNEQARIDKITSLKQQARRATDPKIAAELMAQATDLEMAIGRGGAGSAVAADRQELAELKALLKNAEDTASNPLLPKPTRDAAVKRMEEINRQIAGMTKMGSGGGNAPKIGDVQQGYRFKGGNPADQSNWEKVK